MQCVLRRAGLTVVGCFWPPRAGAATAAVCSPRWHRCQLVRDRRPPTLAGLGSWCQSVSPRRHPPVACVSLRGRGNSRTSPTGHGSTPRGPSTVNSGSAGAPGSAGRSLQRLGRPGCSSTHGAGKPWPSLSSPCSRRISPRAAPSVSPHRLRGRRGWRCAMTVLRGASCTTPLASRNQASQRIDRCWARSGRDGEDGDVVEVAAGSAVERAAAAD